LIVVAIILSVLKKIAKTYSETIFLGPNQLKITISSSAEILSKSLVPNKYCIKKKPTTEFFWNYELKCHHSNING
jgi:hypothetical protein